MPFQHNGPLRWYQFDLFMDQPGLAQGIFTRSGGVSPEPWASLNMATSGGDTRERVTENRQRILDGLGMPECGIFDVWQVHGTEVIPSRIPRLMGTLHQKADAILTDQPGLVLLMLFADCVPIFLYDPRHQAIGIVHAGWQGTVDHVAARAVGKMVSTYGSKPEELMVGIGPSICLDHYEVGLNVIARVDAAFGSEVGLLVHRKNGHAHLDLWKANQLVLTGAGVLPEHIEVAGLCTVEHPQDWYSHRGEKGQTGRFGGAFALRPAGQGAKLG
jgi:YfiH family protein